MQDIYEAAALLATQLYGPLYVVSGRHARDRTLYVYMLDQGQVLLPPRPSVGPNNKHPDLRANQEIFGIVSGVPGWSEEYGWRHEHPNVKDGTAQALVHQLIEASKTAINLGMNDASARNLWLQGWARDNLGTSAPDMVLPNLDTESLDATFKGAP